MNRDFIVSFELEIPRYLGGPSDRQMRHGLDLLDSHRCKKILALSDFARRHAHRRFERFGMSHLAAKMEVFRGGVPNPLPDSDAAILRGDRPTFAEKPLSVAVIGTQLFHKGGKYAIQAVEQLRSRGLNVELTLIGDFETDNHVLGADVPDAATWRARASGADWIRFIGPVANSRVLEELHASDICVNVSLDESLGWLPIEAAMLGVPVIGTGICALPELISDRVTGWVIEMPLREDGRWSGLEMSGPAKRAAIEDANERIVAGITQCLIAVYDDPGLLARWGSAGRKWAMSHYDMASAAQKLEQIYDAALGRD